MSRQPFGLAETLSQQVGLAATAPGAVRSEGEPVAIRRPDRQIVVAGAAGDRPRRLASIDRRQPDAALARRLFELDGALADNEGDQPAVRVDLSTGHRLNLQQPVDGDGGIRDGRSHRATSAASGYSTRMACYSPFSLLHSVVTDAAQARASSNMRVTCERYCR